MLLLWAATAAVCIGCHRHIYCLNLFSLCGAFAETCFSRENCFFQTWHGCFSLGKASVPFHFARIDLFPCTNQVAVLSYNIFVELSLWAGQDNGCKHSPNSLEQPELSNYWWRLRWPGWLSKKSPVSFMDFWYSGLKIYALASPNNVYWTSRRCLAMGSSRKYRDPYHRKFQIGSPTPSRKR